jgi:hypothetical protein
MMTNNKKNWFWEILTAFLLVIIVFGYITLKKPGPVQIYHNVSIENVDPGSTIKPGDFIMMKYEFDRLRFCRTHIDFYIISAATREIVFAKSIVGGSPELGPNIIIRYKLDLPMNLEDGKYEVRTGIVFECEDGSQFVTTPSVFIEVKKD